LILICLGHDVAAIKHFRAGPYFAINVLTETQRPLSDRFARKGQDRFDGLEWQPGESGAPLLPNALANIECAVVQRTAAGDHDIFVGEVVHVRVADGAPLIHYASEYRKLETR
jgi:flavin reductase (DIM6/NTAB) family NADH-FMN oxidoreductase RutF